MEATLQKKTPALIEPAPQWLVTDIQELNTRVLTLATKLGLLQAKKAATAQPFKLRKVTKHYQLPSKTAQSVDFTRISRVIEEIEQVVQAATQQMESAREQIDVTNEQLKRIKQRKEQGTQALIRKSALLQPTPFCERMSWTKQALSKALSSNRVFFVEEEGTRYYPAFYADRAYERRHLEAVTKLLGDIPGSAKLQFFMTGKGSLGGMTPLDALKAGKLAAVKTAAEGFAER